MIIKVLFWLTSIVLTAFGSFYTASYFLYQDRAHPTPVLEIAGDMVQAFSFVVDLARGVSS